MTVETDIAAAAPPRQQALWRRRGGQWGPFILLGLLCLLWTGLDRSLMHSDAAGVALAQGEWQLVVGDMPELWRAWEGLDAYRALEELAPPFMHEGEVAVRQQTGIRPTPARVQRWLGNRALVSGIGPDWCASFRPGVAMRVASALHGLVATPVRPNIRTWGDYAYGWRDGFLVVSPSPERLSDALEHGEVVPATTGDGDSLNLTWSGAKGGALRVDAREGLPFELAFFNSIALKGGPVLHSQDWPDAMAVLSGNSAQNLEMAMDTMGKLAYEGLPPTYRDVWSDLASSWWTSQVPPVDFGSCSGALSWVAVASKDPNAKTEVYMGRVQEDCTQEALHAVAALSNARPYRWDDREGWLIASSHHERSWSVAQVGNEIAWTTSPSLVPFLLDTPGEEAQEGVLYLRAQWKPVAEMGRHVLLQLAENELIPEYWRPRT